MIWMDLSDKTIRHLSLWVQILIKNVRAEVPEAEVLDILHKEVESQHW